MLTKEKKILIVGGNSKISQRLCENLQNDDLHIFKTSRNKLDHHSIFFDMASNEINFDIFPKDIDVVFMSAAITNQTAASENKQFTYLVNVTNTIKLIEYFIKSQTHVIFPSTNLVFDGLSEFPAVDEQVKPQSFYAECKAEVENFLKDKEFASIIRLPKILDKNNPLIKYWIECLLSKKQIEAYNDLMIAPISMDFALKLITKMIVFRCSGVFQVSGSTNISYYNFARRLSYILVGDDNLVQPNRYKENHPVRFATMSDKSVYDEFNICNQNLDDCLLDIVGS